jgi:hypothetical protein
MSNIRFFNGEVPHRIHQWEKNNHHRNRFWRDGSQHFWRDGKWQIFDSASGEWLDADDADDQWVIRRDGKRVEIRVSGEDNAAGASSPSSAESAPSSSSTESASTPAIDSVKGGTQTSQ